LYFCVVDGGETIAIGERAECENLFPLAEKAYLGCYLMADLDEAFVAGEGHNEYWKLNNGRLLMPLDVGLLNNRLILHLFLLLNLLQQLHYPCPLFGIIFKVSCQLFLLLLQIIDLFL